jgi:hypothetical protein
MPPTYSLVAPMFNEEAVIPVLLKRLDAEWKEGYDVVSAERASRQETGDRESLLSRRGTARRCLQSTQRRRFPPGRSPGAPTAARRPAATLSSRAATVLADGPAASNGWARAANPFMRDRIATARILRFTVARRARTGR